MTRTSPRSARFSALTFLLLIPLTAGGCGDSERPRLYTLSDMTDAVAKGTEQRTIGIGPITMPSYLDRPQVVLRRSPNLIEAAEFERWAEPLQEIVPRVLSENLGALLGTDKVYLTPRRRRAPLDLQIEVDISRFEPTEAGSALLVARWAIFRGEGTEPVVDGKSRIVRKGGSEDDYEGLVRLLSEALAGLSAEIAEAIVALP